MKSFEKFVYWLTEAEFISLESKLSEEDIPMQEAKKAVCLPMAKNIEIGYVRPDAWQKYEICKRQLSWYGVSQYAGQYLVVSSFRLDEYGLKPEIQIKTSKFRATKLPDEQKKLKMIETQGYQHARPDEWENIDAEDPKARERWLKIMGIRNIPFEKIFITHCANHANFIEPVYFITEEDEKIPYSIAKTAYICSACLEFYNIIGSEFRKKLVVPCPGGVLFAGLPVNKYLEVTKID